MFIRPLKDGILSHIDEWITTLGKLLEQTAWDRLEKIQYKVEDYSSRLKEVRHSSEMEKTLVLIANIWEMSLEFGKLRRFLTPPVVECVAGSADIEQLNRAVWPILRGLTKARCIPCGI